MENSSSKNKTQSQPLNQGTSTSQCPCPNPTQTQKSRKRKQIDPAKKLAICRKNIAESLGSVLSETISWGFRAECLKMLDVENSNDAQKKVLQLFDERQEKNLENPNPKKKKKKMEKINE